MGNTITLTFAGDDKPIQRTFDAVSDGASGMARNLDKAEDSTGRLSRGVGSMNEKIGDSESKFMGAADLVDGLSSAMGISLGPTVDYARAFGDMAGGFSATLGPAMEGITGKMGKLTAVTKLQAFAQGGLNAVMTANPIFLVVAGIAALIAIFIVAYKKSETFRNIVDGAMAGVRKAVDVTLDKFTTFGRKIGDVVSESAKVIGKIADIITTPYQIAFRGIADLWNNTVGKLHVSIPGFMGFGGISFDVPDIPRLATGGIARANSPHIVGERGPELFVPGMTGTVVPNHALGGMGSVVITFAPGEPMWEALKKQVRVKGGGNVQLAMGT